MKYSLAIVGLWAGLSCATTPPPAPKASWNAVLSAAAPPSPARKTKPASAGPLDADNVALPERTLEEYAHMGQMLTTQVTMSRGLQRREQLKMSMLQDAEFEDALEASRGGKVSAERETAAAAEVFAFGFAPLDAPARPPGKELKIERGGKYPLIIGLYDPDQRVLHVRRHNRANNADDEDLMRQTMAHEIEHALQHQNLPMVDLPGIDDVDTLRAVRSVYEGDAEFARVLSNYPEAIFSLSVAKSVLGAHSAFVRIDSKMSQRLRELGFSESVAGASRYARETSMFPYEQGFVFLARIYRSGGMELVNAVFRHPPTTTEQVLHPEKYVSGEGGIPMALPPVPSGYDDIATGRLGELGVRILLEECATSAVAVSAAEGWGGDAYRVAQDPQGHLALLWNTAWDSEDDAREFEKAVKDRKECWQDSKTEKYHWAIGQHFTVKREGTVVSVVRGLSGEVEKTSLQKLAAFVPKPSPPKVPLGKVQLVPDAYSGIEEAVANESGAAGVLKGRHYLHARMGIQVDLPESVAARVDTEAGSISVATNTEPGALGQLLLIDTQAKSADDIIEGGPGSWSRTVFGKLDEAVKVRSQKERLKVTLNRKLEMPVGQGRLRRWDLGEQKQLEAVFVPICDGKAAFYFVLQWRTGQELSILENWMRAFRLTKGANPPVCSELNATD